LVGRALTPATLQAALLHSYTTAFLWSAVIFVVGAVAAGLVLQRGGLATLATQNQVVKADPAVADAPPVHVSRVRVGCR
jgi:hypothetical protein